jgi:hypothetical protein
MEEKEMRKMTARPLPDPSGLVFVLLIVAMFGTAVRAQCFGSFSDLVAAAASAKETPKPTA